MTRVARFTASAGTAAAAGVGGATTVPAPADVNALAAAIIPHLTAGATADQIAQVVVSALAKKKPGP